MSTPWSVNMISAYGRGETLALQLADEGFDVRLFDFTQALGPEWNLGAGPFPIAATTFLPKQEKFLSEVRPLPRGLVFWLKDGPVELSGPMAEFFAANRAAVARAEVSASADFEQDWLRRFLRLWAAPHHGESWQSKSSAGAFPYADNIGLIPLAKEKRALSFERFQTLDLNYVKASVLRDINFEGARITELQLDGATKAPQWIWCLSSEETERVGAEVASHLFANKIRKPQWRWLSFQGRCHRGPWSSGFPEFAVVIEDLHLPWVYANAMALRWTDKDVFELWMKVPAASVLTDADRRGRWAEEARAILHRRLPPALFAVDANQWSVCPHSPVYDLESREDGLPGWKNWDWISPESLARLDFSARFEREAACYNRLVQWRTQEMKKQGARRDTALHAP